MPPDQHLVNIHTTGVLGLTPLHLVTYEVRFYTDYPIYCMLLFGSSQCNHALLRCSIFTEESSIGCLDITEEI